VGIEIPTCIGSFLADAADLGLHMLSAPIM